MKKRIRVRTQFVGIHNWLGASGRRVYLAAPHRHTFYVEGYAEVTHSDRDIEFHDLREQMDRRIGRLRDRGAQETGCSPIDLGSQSCEDIAEYLLRGIPELQRVVVSEDGECAADLVADDVQSDQRETEFPEVVCLCGSTRSKDATIAEAIRLTREGCVVLSVEFFAHADGVELTEEEKEAFDEAHKRKIDLADRIHVINVNGYVGSSTRSEIKYARQFGKGITAMNEPLLLPDGRE